MDWKIKALICAECLEIYDKDAGFKKCCGHNLEEADEKLLEAIQKVRTHSDYILFKKKRKRGLEI